jgi:hypothetical protein
MDRLDRMITASSAVIGLRAKACAAKQLSRLDGFSEPLSDEQRVVLLLLLASAYTDGMADALRDLAP